MIVSENCSVMKTVFSMNIPIFSPRKINNKFGSLIFPFPCSNFIGFFSLLSPRWICGVKLLFLAIIPSCLFRFEDTSKLAGSDLECTVSNVYINGNFSKYQPLHWLFLKWYRQNCCVVKQCAWRAGSFQNNGVISEKPAFVKKCATQTIGFAYHWIYHCL